MTYHKISGIEKSVCTAEQKIAYNLASSYANLYTKSFCRLIEHGAAEVAISAAIDDIHAHIMRLYITDATGKYDIDGISCALRAGLREYLQHPLIACDYVSIGRAFPARYL